METAIGICGVSHVWDRRKFIKTIMGGAAVVGTGALAACSDQDEQNIINGINTLCTLLPVGAAITIAIASSIAGGLGAVTITKVVQEVGSTVCQDLESSVKSALDYIVSLGGTATVTANTTAPATPAATGLMQFMHRFGARPVMERGKLHYRFKGSFRKVGGVMLGTVRPD